MQFLAALLALATLTACESHEPGLTGGGGSGGAGGDGAGGGGAGPTSAYDPAHVLDVQITLSDQDWASLRFQGNDPLALLGGQCLAGPKQTDFTYFNAAVAIDGTTFPDVAVRKKGFLGSLSVSKPSFKIKLDEYMAGARYLDTDKLTLNNLKQDAALVRTCLAFELFARAGVPASRCTFAHVTVNGEDLGIYANVEAVGKSMLGRTFSDDSGNLYEGQLSDVREEWVDTYEKKSNEDDPDRSDIEGLRDALLAEDATLLDEVGERLDIEAFLTFWAMESLLGAWDGYTNNQNNHFIYHDPSSGKLHFLPWSPDMSFVTEDPFSAPDRPQSVSAAGALPNRLYALGSMRDRYRERVLELNDAVMNPADVASEIESMAALLSPYVDDAGLFESSLDEVRQFAAERQAMIAAELADGPAVWPYPLKEDPCVVEIGTVSGSFTTTAGSGVEESPFDTGDGTLHIEIGGAVEDAFVVGAASSMGDTTSMLQIIAIMPDGSVRGVIIFIDDMLFDANVLPFDWQQAFGVYGAIDTETEEFTLIGILNGPSITLTTAALSDGSPVEGTFQASLMQ